MKLINESLRNVNVLQNYGYGQGSPFRVMIVAGSTLELSDEDFEKVKKPIKNLVEAGVLKILIAPDSKFSREELIAKIYEETGIKLPEDGMNKAEVQSKAEVLGVSTEKKSKKKSKSSESSTDEVGEESKPDTKAKGK